MNDTIASGGPDGRRTETSGAEAIDQAFWR